MVRLNHLYFAPQNVIMVYKNKKVVERSKNQPPNIVRHTQKEK